jgi:hypothetical protein
VRAHDNAGAELTVLDLIQSRRRGAGSQFPVLHPEAGQEHWCDRLRDQCIRRQRTKLSSSSSPRADSTQVQGEAQGSDDAIKQFVQHLNKGPSAASVSGVEHSDISTKSGESGFNVK